MNWIGFASTAKKQDMYEYMVQKEYDYVGMSNTKLMFFLVYKSQQDAQFTEFILSENFSTCFGFHYHPSSGAQNTCNYSIW